MVFLWCLLTFVLGVFVGHRLVLGRDRRTEINALFAPIRGRLVVARDDPVGGFHIDSAERHEVTARLDEADRRRFEDALERMKAHRPIASSQRHDAVRVGLLWRKPADAEAWRRAVDDALASVRVR